jgi:glycosyltransferase involved in cell wall biosynthesis
MPINYMIADKVENTKNTISVIIPTRNRLAEVSRAIDSVLKQSIKPIEVIVVDDASTDNTTTALKANYPNIKLIINEVNKGGAISRNIGAESATGKYIAFLDSDDEWLPEHLKDALDLITKDKADGVFGIFWLHTGLRKNVVQFFNTTNYAKGEMGKNIFSFKRFDARTSTFILNRESFLKIKFDPQLAKHQDWDFAINFDQTFLWTINTNPSVIINAPSSSSRMSSSLNHNASFYFLKKNAAKIDPNSIFYFCIKQIMRSQNINEPRSHVDQYVTFLTPYKSDLNWVNRFIYMLVRYRLLNISYLYKLKNLIKS